MDCNLQGSTVHGISQARMLEWVAISFSMGSSRHKDWTWVSWLGRWILYHQGGPGYIYVHVCVCVCIRHSVMLKSLQPHGLQLVRLLCPWNSPGKNTEVCCHSLLKRIFPTQVLNSGLPHCGQILYYLRHWGSPGIRVDAAKYICICHMWRFFA